MIEDKKSAYKHSIYIEEREKLSVSGVTDVISFDEESIVAQTDLGTLIIDGENLHVNKLNLEMGELTIDGEIAGIRYTDETQGLKSKSSFMGKLFK